jgi:Cu-Zn family superoxide dismutase
MKRAALVLALAGTAIAGCAAMGGGGAATASASLEPTRGNAATGSVTFTQVGERVRVNATVSGLKPNAEHGFHVHEKGDCSSGDGMSAGGHFNPAGRPHGQHPGAERHAGDMPNLRADASGRATATFEITNVAIGQGSSDIVGKGLIVHRDPDDYKSQPAGNAGPRLACAVIRRS